MTAGLELDRYRSDLAEPNLILTIWNLRGSGISPFSPTSPRAVEEWVRTVERDGGAILVDNRYCRPMNHHIIGVGAGHNDADFAETGRSQAAWQENGDLDGSEPYQGRQIEACRLLRRELDRQAREAARARRSARGRR